MLSVIWARSSTKLHFSFFTENNWLDFWQAIFDKDSSILMADEATPVGKAQTLANTGTDRLLHLML